MRDATILLLILLAVATAVALQAGARVHLARAARFCRNELRWCRASSYVRTTEGSWMHGIPGAMLIARLWNFVPGGRHGRLLATGETGNVLWMVGVMIGVVLAARQSPEFASAAVVALWNPTARAAFTLIGWDPVKLYGAKGNAVEVTDGAVAAGTSVLTSTQATFTLRDLGKKVRVIQQSFTITGDTTSGSTSITNVTGWPAGLTNENGMAISGDGIRAGSTIKTGAGTGTIVLPGTGTGMAATKTATGVTLTVSGYVALSTTITGYTNSHQVTLAATWGGSTGLSGCVVVYGSDDTTPLNTVLNTTNRTVRYIAHGGYLATSTIDIPAGSASNLNIVGSNAAKIIVAPGVNDVGVQINQTGNDLAATTRGTRVVVRDLRIDGYGYAQRQPSVSGTAATFSMIGCDGARLDNMEVGNARDAGFNIRGCNDVLVTGCRQDGMSFGLAGNSFNLAGGTNYTSTDLIAVGCKAFNVSDIGFCTSTGGITGRRMVSECISVGGNSGVLAEGVGVADSSNVWSITACKVYDCLNIGIGCSSSGSVVEHRHATITGNHAINCAIGIEYVGQNATITGNTVKGYTGTGIWVGGGDFDEVGTTITGNVVTAAATGSPSNAINVTKSGLNTNYIRGLVITGNRLDGGSASTGGQRGISLTGKLRNVGVIGNSVNGFRFSGIYCDNSGGASPSSVRIIGNDSRNNNQAASGTAANQAGIGIEGATDTVLIQGNVCTDDQAVKTQQIGLHWLGGTKGRIFNNDFSGNGATGVSAVFDQNTLARNNAGWSIISVASASTITLPPGEMVRVTGTTQIDTVNVPPAGVSQIIRFAAALTLKNSATLKLAGAADFSATADDALTIVSDGTTMWEVARSVN